MASSFIINIYLLHLDNIIYLLEIHFKNMTH